MKDVLDNCDFCDIFSGKTNYLYCKKANNFLEAGENSYGIKDGQFKECGSNECPKCQMDSNMDVLECNNNSKFLLNNLIIILLFVLLGYYC